MKLLLDEMLSRVVGEQLRNRGHDVLAVDESPELRGRSDPDLFEHAQQDGRAIVTYNRDDFLALDRLCRQQGRDHHGIVILNPRRFPPGAATTGALITSIERFITAKPPYRAFIHWLQ